MNGKITSPWIRQFFMAVILGALGWVALSYSRHFNLMLPHSAISQTVGISFLVMGIIIRILAFIQVPHTHRINRLVTSGIYSRTRNPIYLAYIFIITAVAFLTMRLLSFVWVLVSILVFYWVAKEEENDLKKRFGEEYATYRRTVPLFLPRINP